jgi:hypothetical protein
MKTDVKKRLEETREAMGMFRANKMEIPEEARVIEEVFGRCVDAEEKLESLQQSTVNINFGKGRLLINKFTADDSRRGLIIKDTGEDHPVGATANDEPIGRYQIQPGEIVMWFSNPESALVVRELLDELLENWHPEPRNAHRV